MSGRWFAAWAVALVPLLAYGGWVVLAACMLLAPWSPSPWRAATILTAGHRLSAADLVLDRDMNHENPAQVLDTLVGLYLNKSVEKDIAIMPTDVGPRPILVRSEGHVFYFAPLENNSELRPFLDAGSEVTLCWAKADCIADVRVLSVNCEQQESICVAITEVPADQLDKTGSRDELRIFLH